MAAGEAPNSTKPPAAASGRLVLVVEAGQGEQLAAAFDPFDRLDLAQLALHRAGATAGVLERVLSVGELARNLLDEGGVLAELAFGLAQHLPDLAGALF